MYYIQNLEERSYKIKKKSVQEWFSFETILEDGIIKYKNKYVKIIKILPVNFDLKSELEKKAILNSYKLFLKTCNFNIQILIQSKKQDLTSHIFKIKKVKEENPKIKELKEEYISYINEKNSENNSSIKVFYIIIEYKIDKKDVNNFNNAKRVLNDNYFKIKESLSRCGNIIYNISEKKETFEILKNFYNLER
ncbi:MAG: hypothetical protein HFJ46_03735 [Clostridia bacterium]|nr:hypothetical protein [Clostridia bacterium]